MQKVNRKGMLKELTRSGHPTFTASFSPEQFGTFYPDEIPVSTYNKMRQDPQIALGISIIKLPIMSLLWIIDCEDNDVAAFVTEALKPIWRRLMNSMLTAVDYGFVSHEKVWERMPMDVSSVTESGRKKTHFRGQAEVYRKLKAHYPDTIRIRTDGKTDDFLGIVQDIGGGQTVTLDKDKCFFFSLEDEFGNYYGQSRLKQAYKPWYWKEVLYQFMLRYYERRGSPPTLVTYPIGKYLDASNNEVDNCNVALQLGQSLIENSVATMPYEATKDGRDNMWNVGYLHDEKRGTMFIDAITHLETQILRGLLVPERVVTQDIATGSYSMAATHAEAFLLSQEGLIATIEEAINTQLIPPLVQFNFKPKSWLPCVVKMEGIQHDRKRLLKEIFIEIMRNISVFTRDGIYPNVMPNLEEMAEVLKVPLSPFLEEFTQLGVPKGNGAKPGEKPTEEEGAQPPSAQGGGEEKAGGDQDVGGGKVTPIRKQAGGVVREPVII
jgi:hypothetical protein